MKLMVALVVIIFLSAGLALECYTCNQGYESRLQCSNIVPKDMKMECEVPNARCLEAVEWFQNGALRLVRRQCWPFDNFTTNTDFCGNYNNPIGNLIRCRTCDQDLCNGNVIYQPNPFLACGE